MSTTPMIEVGLDVRPRKKGGEVLSWDGIDIGIRQDGRIRLVSAESVMLEDSRAMVPARWLHRREQRAEARRAATLRAEQDRVERDRAAQQRVEARAQAEKERDALAAKLADVLGPEQFDELLSHVTFPEAKGTRTANALSRVRAMLGVSRLPTGVPSYVQAAIELALPRAREAWEAAEAERWKRQREECRAREAERIRLDAPRKRVEDAIHVAYSSLLRRGVYRRSQSIWAGGGHRLDVTLVSNGAAPTCSGDSTRVWSHIGKWSGTDSVHRLHLRPDWPERVGADLSIVGARLILDAAPVQERENVWEAIRAVPSRGCSIRPEAGFIARTPRDLAWAFTLASAVRMASHGR